MNITAMTDTTPDYAGLSRRLGALAYHIQQTGKADGQDAQTCHEAAEALRALLERNAALERERANLIETKREQIDRLQKERDALVAENDRLRAARDAGAITMTKTLEEMIAELRRLEAEEIQEKVARHLCKLMDDEWKLGSKLYMSTAKEILDDIALPELLKALETYQQLYGPKPVVSGSLSSALPPHGGVDVG